MAYTVPFSRTLFITLPMLCIVVLLVLAVLAARKSVDIDEWLFIAIPCFVLGGAAIIALIIGVFVYNIIPCIAFQPKNFTEAGSNIYSEQQVLADDNTEYVVKHVVTIPDIQKVTGIAINRGKQGNYENNASGKIDYLDEQGKIHQGGSIIYNAPDRVYLFDEHGKPLHAQKTTITDRMIVNNNSFVKLADKNTGVRIGNSSYYIEDDKYVSQNTKTVKQSPAPSATIAAVTVRGKDNYLHTMWAMDLGGHLYLVPQQ